MHLSQILLPRSFLRMIPALCAAVAAALPASAQEQTPPPPPSAPPAPAPSVTPPAADRFDLYLLVGQSNMAGRGKLTPADRAPDPRVLVLGKDDQWVRQGEPLHFDKKEAGVGLGFTFAKRMADRSPGVVIGLIPCAVGGTPQSRWMPGSDGKAGGDLYEAAVRRAKIAQQAGRLKGILWHQGESECGSLTKAQAYAEGLALIVAGFRRDLNVPDAPFVAGELGEFLYTRSGGKSPYAKIVNEQIDRLPTLVPGTAVVSSAGLAHKGDELHFDADAQREFGRRYFEAMAELQKKAGK
ncbi:sialate O-acetylesterase [Opitutaceae bacterium TAV4]|nr:sialate O-acetylesterase [Opitutaceae bacterium TAV4]